MAKKTKAKHRQVYEHVHNGILSGKYGVGQRIPTEAELALLFDASRVTVARALRDLQQQGFLNRRRGAGSFVRRNESASGQLLGLIAGETPGIFATICDEMARVAQEKGFGVLLGKWPIADTEEIIRFTEELSTQYIERKVAGVFFTPMLVLPEQMMVNVRITEAFDRAGIAVVLLDCDIHDYPQRSKFDLAGVDNVYGGFVLTEHLLGLGYQRVHFMSVPATASSVTARIAGYRQALIQHEITPDPQWVHRGDSSQIDFVRSVMEGAKAEAFVCANDYEAAKLMRQFARLGVRVPQDVAVVGVNDDPYASLLNVPLTTLRQPCAQLGAAAVQLMQQRLEGRGQVTREIQLSCELIVRESCGAPRHAAQAALAG